VREVGPQDDGPSDAELVEKARRGDEHALDTLVRRHHAAAHRVAASIVRDADAAQDVVQDAFIKAFRALDGFRGDSSFGTWLLTITANEARGALRRVVRRRETSLDDVTGAASEGMAPDSASVLALEAQRARVMLGRLPDKQRLSVTLRIEEGLSFREIGKIIGSSEGAARVNYFHGIRRLRELLE